MSLYISIGRNYGALAGPREGQPMTTNEWSWFKQLTEAAVRAHTAGVFTDAEGLSSWQGQSEDTHLWVAAGDSVPHALATALGSLAAQFFQDAIAVSVGVPTFIQPQRIPYVPPVATLEAP